MGSKPKLVKRMWTLETITVVGKKLDLSDLVRVLSFKETDPHPPPHKCFPWGLRSAFNESQRRANWIFIVTFNFQFSIVNLDRTQMWGDWIFIATSCLDMFPAMCAPADISFYSIFQAAPNKMSKHNMSTCWNIHSGPKANFEIELEPICYCSLWLKGFEKRNNLHLSETNCHRTINHWEVSSSSLPHYKHLINLPFSIYQREGCDVDRGEMTC